MRESAPETRETSVFARLDVTVEVVRVAGRLARIVVQAPAEFDVLRSQSGASGDAPPPRVLTHRQRNWLNTASLALHLARKQLATHQLADAETALQRAIEQLTQLEASMADVSEGSDARSLDAARTSE